MTEAILHVRQNMLRFKEVNECLVDQRFEDFDQEKADWAITGGLRQVRSFLQDGHVLKQIFNKETRCDGHTFLENFGQDRRKF